MYRSWDTIIAPLLERLQPGVLVEIGSDKGDNTSNLLEFCERNGGVLHVIDPLPKYDVAEWQQRYGEKLIFHRALSLDALSDIDRMDAVLIDGDHNWHTVFNELKAIEKASAKRGFPLVMLHDIGWPYGRRDLYYDPDTIPDEHRNRYSRAGMSPGSDELVENGGYNSRLSNAVHEGGACNGVLTAVEDFLKQTTQEFEFRQIPGLHGLGILIPSGLKERNGDLAGFLDTLNPIDSARSTEQIEQVERSRLRAEMALQEGRKRIERMRSISQKDRRENAELRRKLEQKKRNIRQLVRWIETLDAGVTAVLGSRRWKIGSLLGDLSQRRLPRRGEEPAEVGSIREVLGRFHAWRKARSPQAPARKDVGASKSPSSGPAPGRIGPESKNGIRRVQVGCGPHNIMEDWWNVDLHGFPGIDAVMDATKPWPYEDLKYVYGEHFLEHLTLDGAIDFLRHAGNSLRIGGILRLSTPNLEWVLHTHYPYGESGPEGAVSGALRMNRAFHGWGHQFLYSEGMLAYILEDMGFEGISFFSYGESDTPALKNVEKHGNFTVDDGYPSVIIAEARRGEQHIEPSQELSARTRRDYLNFVRPGAR